MRIPVGENPSIVSRAAGCPALSRTLKGLRAPPCGVSDGEEGGSFFGDSRWILKEVIERFGPGGEGKEVGMHSLNLLKA